jgi:hypothetical protein
MAEEKLYKRTDIFGQFLDRRVVLYNFFASDELLHGNLRLGPFGQFLKSFNGPLCVFESDHSVVCTSAECQYKPTRLDIWNIPSDSIQELSRIFGLTLDVHKDRAITTYIRFGLSDYFCRSLRFATRGEGNAKSRKDCLLWRREQVAGNKLYGFQWSFGSDVLSDTERHGYNLPQSR